MLELGIRARKTCGGWARSIHEADLLNISLRKVLRKHQ
jgi:hypothetical protein